jgi:hypothetical protein
VDYFYQVDAYPELREDLHEDAHAGQTAASQKSSASAEAPGQRLLKWLTSGVIAVLLVYGLVLATAHVLARIVGMPRAQIVLAQLYPGDYWWHPTDKAYAKELLREAVSAGDANAQYVLACSFEDGKNYAQAFPLYQDLALKGWAGSPKTAGRDVHLRARCQPEHQSRHSMDQNRRGARGRSRPPFSGRNLFRGTARSASGLFPGGAMDAVIGLLGQRQSPGQPGSSSMRKGKECRKTSTWRCIGRTRAWTPVMRRRRSRSSSFNPSRGQEMNPALVKRICQNHPTPS